MATRIVMERDLAHRLNDQKIYPVTGTATGGDVTSLIDANALTYSSGDTNAFDRLWVYREASAGNAISEARVTEGGLNASGGDLTISPTLSNGFVNTDLYIISQESPAERRDALDQVHTNMYEETLWPLSLHIMGNDANDMEPSTIATDYTSEGTSALATETTIVFNGAQSLKTTASAANSGASTGNISVFEGKLYYAAVMCSVQQNDAAQFYAANVQNSDAQIDDDAVTDEPSWTELIIQFTPPVGCEQVDIFMLGTGSNDVIYWDDFQIWQASRGIYPLPSFITRPEQVVEVRAFPRGTTGPASDLDWRADERQSQPLSWGFERGDRRADVPVRIWVENPGSSRPFVVLKRDLGVLASDTTSSPADQDDVVRWAVRYIKAEDSEKADVLARLRARYFLRATTTLPVRIASG